MSETNSDMLAADVPAALVPIGDVLLQTGALSDEDARRVAEHRARTGLDFDRAAIDLALATPEDVARARAQLEGRLALSLAPTADVSEELVVLSDPNGTQAEAIRLLRTQIIAQHIGAGRRALAVCAAVDGSGATYIAANLAAALSQVGFKTLLVDANLRNPRIDSMFGIDPSGPGLTSYLALEANRPERVIYPDVLPNLSVLPSGPPVGRPQELLSGARFRAGVDIVLREFDIAIFDTPATNESADALTVAGLIGYALVVARRHMAYVKDVQTLAQQLLAARATIIGSVLNEYQ
ncbi:CpsD/CapB family tyrosine-protein kinase [Thermaurantiacus sp.]